jgi:hypothetical protein
VWISSNHANTLLQTQGGIVDAIFSLLKRSWKWPGRSVLVKISAVCCSEETETNLMVLWETWCRTKWQSISMCFVRSWNTLLWEICIALLLSQWSIVAEECGTPMSVNSHRNQINSEEASAIAWYSDSALERATTVCFFATPRDKRIAQEETISSYRPTISWISTPISIRVARQH